MYTVCVALTERKVYCVHTYITYIHGMWIVYKSMTTYRDDTCHGNGMCM